MGNVVKVPGDVPRPYVVAVARCRVGGYAHGRRGSVVAASTVSGSVTYDAPLAPNTFYRRRYQPALTAAGLPSGRGGVRLHDLRHTCASLCASAGVKSQQVAEDVRRKDRGPLGTLLDSNVRAWRCRNSL